MDYFATDHTHDDSKHITWKKRLHRRIGPCPWHQCLSH